MKAISRPSGRYEVLEVNRTQREKVTESMLLLFFLIDSIICSGWVMGSFAFCFPQSLENKQINHKLSA